jgi:rhodanese-related sulfurtransferase
MVRSITTDELQFQMASHPVRLVDVREVHEYRSGHVPGAVNIPLSTLSSRVRELPAGETLHVICQSGNRSLRACVWLDQLGHDVINVAGGTGTWIVSGKPVKRVAA